MKKLLLFGILLTVSGLVSGQNEALGTLVFQKQGNHSFIKVKVNDSDKELFFLFDTGAGSTVIDAQYAQEHSLQRAEKDTLLETAGGNYKVPMSMNNHIHLAGLTFSGINFFIDDLSHIHFGGEPIVGVVGYELMKNYIVEIDYTSTMISFYSPNSNYFDEYKQIPIQIIEEIPALPVSITTRQGKKKSGLFYIDSGANIAMSYNSSYAQREMEGEYDKNYSVPVVDANNTPEFSAYLGSVTDLSLGTFTFYQVPVSISGAKDGVTSSSVIDGLIGAEILKRFTLVFDYRHQYIKLIPNENYHQSFSFNLSGLIMKTVNKRVVVTHVIKNSPADQSGFKVNDTLISVNQQAYTSTLELRNALHIEGQVQKCEIIRDGKNLIIEVVPKRFY